MRPISPRLLTAFPLLAALAGIAALLIPILLGASTPRPPGELILALDPPAPADFDPPLPELIEAGPDEQRRYLVVEGPLGLPGSIEVTLREISGEGTAFYGLGFGPAGSDEQWLALIDRDHFVAVYQLSGDQRTGLWEPTRFPYLKGPGEINRLRVDFYPDRFEVRINAELVAAFAWEPPSEITAALWIETGAGAQLELRVEALHAWSSALSLP